MKKVNVWPVVVLLAFTSLTHAFCQNRYAACPIGATCNKTDHEENDKVFTARSSFLDSGCDLPVPSSPQVTNPQLAVMMPGDSSNRWDGTCQLNVELHNGGTASAIVDVATVTNDWTQNILNGSFGVQAVTIPPDGYAPVQISGDFFGPARGVVKGGDYVTLDAVIYTGSGESNVVIAANKSDNNGNIVMGSFGLNCLWILK